MKNRVESENFHPRQFVGNNIEYRIGSSAALARFKESQSFLLNQLAMNPFHEFSRTAREILLFKFDVWFDFLCEVEQYILINQGECDFNDIRKMADARRKYVYKTLREETDSIEQEYLEVYIKSITSIKPYLEGSAKSIFKTDISPSSKFGALVDLAIQTISHILYVVQELDVIFFSDRTPILNLDAMSCGLEIPFSDEGVICSSELRLIEYQKVRPFDELIIKNYLQRDVLVEKSPLSEALARMNIKYRVI